MSLPLKEEFIFEKLYQKYWKKLYILCYSKTKNVEVSEEIVHDVFISLWKYKEDFVVTKGTENYLLKSTKSKIVDYYRKMAKSQCRTVSDCNLCKGQNFDSDIFTHNLAMHKFLEDDLELVVDQLPCKCQEVYRLSREEHLTTNEIAIRLSISQKTVKNHLTKALSFIKEHLEPIL
ncbi:sigma-70 family RNA polymerase sigma factor [Flavivirga sp. 57AJ16]|uniref:sigma-70 family RNA polymerase sigma factor n=1 Tax=Flavivirga sp. 57AJ16 TaxID=3025307 RepID=UPI0023667218|nr:sigma-70 family RNA polymerase sigma factor [Flavivirga sp. 57AJ16]MDD7886949.1 sigma-70 family RNA polymerase sigma factor [Flavivirga sp. 57AJ16]